MEKETISFEDFLKFKGILNPKNISRFRKAYIKVSSHILCTQQINIAKIRSPKQMAELIRHCQNIPDFMDGQDEEPDYYLYILDRFWDYIKYISPTIRICEDGYMKYGYEEDFKKDNQI